VSGPIDQGQTWRYRQTVTDTNGTLADAGTVTAAVTLPDGTAVTPAPTFTHTSTGTYDLAYLTAQSGLHVLRTTATGGILGTTVDVWEDVFTVESAGLAFIAVDEASAHLRAAGIITSTADREQLRWLCLSACSAVEDDLSRAIAPRTVTEVHSGEQGQRQTLILRQSPVISVTSVVENGATLTTGDYTPDLACRVLHRGGTLWPQHWLSGVQNITVIYRAGTPIPPRIARKVALGVVERSWQASQQAPHEAFDAAGAATEVSAELTGVEKAAYDGLRSPGIG